MNRTARRLPNLTTVYWLIEIPEAARSEVFTVRVDAERAALPVFSFPDEAEMFLRLGGWEREGWRAVESTAGEIFPRLAAYRRAGVELVALDPLPEMMVPAFDETISLVTLSLHGFVERHVDGPEERLTYGQGGLHHGRSDPSTRRTGEGLQLAEETAPGAKPRGRRCRGAGSP